jgi:dTDP-4-dehydrorhamnose reductase
MKILILGGTGMLGFQLLKTSSNYDYQFFTVVRNKLILVEKLPDFPSENIFQIDDILNFPELEKIIFKIKPNFIVNAIGIVKQAVDNGNYVKNIEINSLLPHKLAEFLQLIDGRLIHISTDCVFDGIKGNYSLNDHSNAIDIYGKSKFLGEISYGRNVTLRTSIIGHELSQNKMGLLDWFLTQNESVFGYINAIFSGVTTLELSHIIYGVIINSKIEHNGIFQVATLPINKLELLTKFRKIYNKNIEIISSGDLKINRSLNGNLFNEKFKYNPPNWETMLKELKADWKI